MAVTAKTRRTCPRGHEFWKSSDCPTCPICEGEKAPAEGFLAKISAPARQALDTIGVKTLKQLARRSEKEIAGLHGMGPKGVRILRECLAGEKLAFRKS